MNINDFKNIEMTTDEKLEAVETLKSNLEENFISLGQLLSEIKTTKLFKFKGYKTFKEFVEEEYNLSGSFASSLVSTYELFFNQLHVDEKTAETIGLNKLNMIKPMLKDAAPEETEIWIQKAKSESTADLRDEIKDIRNRKKENSKSMKDVFVEQYFERMTTSFNCSKKELNFKLALFFQDKDLEEVINVVTVKQTQYEELSLIHI